MLTRRRGIFLCFVTDYPPVVAHAIAGSHRSAASDARRFLQQAVATDAPTDVDSVIESQHRYDDASIAVTVLRAGDGFEVDIVDTSAPPRPHLILHWAMNDWEGGAVDTPFDASGRLSVRFPSSESIPSRLVFVLRHGEDWINSGAGDFIAQIKRPDASDMLASALAAETTRERWSLFDRFVMAAGMVDGAAAAGPEGMAVLLTWLRLSSQRQLPWYKGSNYQSKDAAHAQKQLAQRMADVAARTTDPLTRCLARATAATLPRGGGNGDDIRHGILNVMRDNGIREGHRPGIEDRFIESWHQKLHTNTTPEDVTICEAYLAFLYSGDMGEFWRVAWERGRLTPESLASMDHPVDPSPFHMPNLIPAFEWYLTVLKRTHTGADLDVAFEMSRGRLDGDLAWTIGDILANRNEWWVPGKIVDARRRLAGYWQSPVGAPRDVLLLDVALDAYFRLCIERMDKGALTFDDLMNVVGLVLDNIAITGESHELAAAAAFWGRLLASKHNHNEEWSALALAATEFVSLCLEEFADSIVQLVQPVAERFGGACGIDQAYIINFSEEVVRSHPAFVLSPLLQRLGPHLRGLAGLGAWQIVSQMDSSSGVGRVVCMPDLADLQGRPPAVSTVVIAERLDGNEDIPVNVVAVLTSAATDVLSHVAIRARAQKVLLASCFDVAEMEALRGLNGKVAEVAVTPGGGEVQARVVDGGLDTYVEEQLDDGAKNRKAKGTKAPKLKKRGDSTAPSAVSEAKFTAELVGNKALNLAALRSQKLPDWIHIPASIALPFGTFERVLSDPANAAAAATVAGALKELAAATRGEGIPPVLRTLREIIRTQLMAPESLKEAVKAAGKASGLAVATTAPTWTPLWAAICGVWASKWNDRAWLSRGALGMAEDDLVMSVLVQQIVAARYAFVLHTADPLTGRGGNLHGELVIGMGEALVGNFPGRALSFSQSSESSQSTVVSFPSKKDALWADAEVARDSAQQTGPRPLFIARSDSNGEDLEGFAGAGLYSSVPAVPFRRESIKYANEPLLWDASARAELLEKLVEVGKAVEVVCGGPQDVEGVIDEQGNVWVVQARAQVVH